MSSQNEKRVRVDRRDYVALVMLTESALNRAMIEELIQAFTALQKDSGVRAVVLTGAEEVFSAGAGIEEMTAWTPEQAQEFARAGQSLTGLIENLGKPVIAAVNGLAAGGGCELALACAWRIASPKASFALPEVSAGFLPGFGSASRLAGIISKARALEMILSGEAIQAKEALRIGLVNRVPDKSEELLTVSLTLAEQICRNAPLAVKYAIETINHGGRLSLEDGLRLESAFFGLCFATRDVEEGTKAFLEKRPPVFTGQ
ncbi:MAG TPA: enoyl-CoA hydratase-related protein [Blastocatellia bacterium]|nr:enoyl-CoA hydratase-related protein [Blastocatellia bacterium]HMV83627.1 enoyl-CoA hydratase-related protein [Blastocatellia bacterium]HNG28400.1 enoyl-CoA hydratase-related protein [Blastocatellia bacterium]